MATIINSSPLIFLSRLAWLEEAIRSFDELILPEAVADEIAVKNDDAARAVQQAIVSKQLTVKKTTLRLLVQQLQQRLGKGESEAIALAVELQAERIILDDNAARKEAMRLGLNVRGTLAIIRKLHIQGVIKIASVDERYQMLSKIHFRIERRIVEDIFRS